MKLTITAALAGAAAAFLFLVSAFPAVRTFTLPTEILFPSAAHAQMSKDGNAMRKKAEKINAEASARTRAATERMQRILREKREGTRYGFPDDFNTIPGDKKQR